MTSLKMESNKINSKRVIDQLKQATSHLSICEVTWLDIVSEHRKKLNDVISTKPRDMLATCSTYGYILEYDDSAIVVVTEDSGDEVDYTVIPIHCIIAIEILKGGEKDE